MQFNVVVPGNLFSFAVYHIKGVLVTTSWRILRFWREETVSRYGG